MSELKRCPFCGEDTVTIEQPISLGDSYPQISCHTCEKSFIWATDEGVRVWNTRPLEDELLEKVEQLSEENGRLKKAQEWVSIDDPPKRPGWYLVYDKCNHGVRVSSFSGNTGTFFRSASHWKPLPSPPEAE